MQPYVCHWQCGEVSERGGLQEALQKHYTWWSSWIECFSLGCCYWKWGNTVALTAECAIHYFLLGCDFHSLVFSLKSYLATLFFFFSNQTIFIPVKIQHFGFLWTICSLMQTCTNIVCCFFEMEEYCLGEMCFQFSFLRHSYRMKISSLSLSQEMKELHSIILMGCVICSCTGSSTHPAKVNSKVFTEWATEEMHLYGSDPGWDYVVFKVWWLPKSPGSG